MRAVGGGGGCVGMRGEGGVGGGSGGDGGVSRGGGGMSGGGGGKGGVSGGWRWWWRCMYSQVAQVRTWLFEFQALGCSFRRAFWSEVIVSSMGAAGLRSVLYIFQHEFSIQNRTHTNDNFVITKCNFT